MRILILTMIFSAMLGLQTGTLFGEEQAAAAGEATLIEQVRQAYADAKQYQATVTFSVDSHQGRWFTSRRAEIYVALDRVGNRLMIDKPEFRLVVDGGQLRMNSDQLPGAYMEVGVGDSLVWSDVIQAVPPIAEPPQIDAIFLLAKDPVGVLTGGGGGEIETGDGPWQLRVNQPGGSLTLHINPKTHLIDRAVMTVGGGTAVVTYVFKVGDADSSLHDDLFAFDTQGSDPADSIQAMIQIVQAKQQQQGGGAPGGPGASGGPGAGGHPLQDQDAPEIESTTMTGDAFKLSEVEADVVVLDFWATWCPPCRKGLPQIQAVADWAKEEGKSVAVYAVNVGETVDKATGFWTEQGFTMPVVMDEQSQASTAYGVQGIPQTVIIANGKVIAVHVGLVPNLEQTLKDQINAALEGDPKAEPEAAG